MGYFVQRAGAALLLFAIVSGACQSTATAPGPKATEGPVDPRLTTLAYGVPTEPGSFDPHTNVTIVGGYRFYPAIYETLIRYGVDGSLQPMLAESWSTPDSGKTYRFKLRSGVKFSDGTPFNTQAVADALSRMRTLNKGAVALFAPIESVKPVDDLSFDLVMKQPFAPILATLAGWQGAMFVSPAAVKANDKGGDLAQAWLNDHTAGTGPFMLESWERNARIVFVRNPHYRVPVAPADLQRIVMPTVKEAGTLRQQLAAGDLDMVEELTPAVIDALRQTSGVKVNLDAIQGSVYGQHIVLNLTKKPFDNVNFRRAIAYAVDYKRLVTVWNGVAEQAQGPLLPTFSPWFSAKDAVQYQQDSSKVAEELRKAGYTMPISPRLKFNFIWQAGQSAQRDMALLIKEDLSKIGIDMEVQEVELPVWREAIWKHTFEMAHSQQSLRYSDPDAYATLYSHSSEWRDGGFNPGIRDPKMDELVRTASSTIDPAARRTLYNDWQRRMTEDVMILYLVNKKQAWANGTNVSGLTWNPNYGPMFDFTQVRKTAVRGR